MSRYFYGVEYAARDVRLGLVEASQNRIGSAVDQLLLLCFHYDPSKGKYGFAILSAVRIVNTPNALLSRSRRTLSEDEA